MAHGDAREGKWRGNWRMEWVASTLHTTSEHGVSSIATADAHTSAASSRLNWCPRRLKLTCPFRRKTIPGFCECAITFQLASTRSLLVPRTALDGCEDFRLHWDLNPKSSIPHRLSYRGLTRYQNTVHLTKTGVKQVGKQMTWHRTRWLIQISSFGMWKRLSFCILSFGWFPAVWVLYGDVSAHCLFHLHM